MNLLNKLVIVIASCVTLYDAKVTTPVLPEPTGPYGVGRVSYSMTDPSRLELLSGSSNCAPKDDGLCLVPHRSEIGCKRTDCSIPPWIRGGQVQNQCRGYFGHVSASELQRTGFAPQDRDGRECADAQRN